MSLNGFYDERGLMISESVIIFGGTGNVVMVLNGILPRNAAVMFKISPHRIDLLVENSVIYSEKGLTAYTCDRLKRKNEIGLVEVLDVNDAPKQLTNVAYQMTL
jgi:hypothetical protein